MQVILQNAFNVTFYVETAFFVLLRLKLFDATTLIVNFELSVSP